MRKQRILEPLSFIFFANPARKTSRRRNRIYNFGALMNAARQDSASTPDTVEPDPLFRTSWLT